MAPINDQIKDDGKAHFHQMNNAENVKGNSYVQTEKHLFLNDHCFH